MLGPRDRHQEDLSQTQITEPLPRHMCLAQHEVYKGESLVAETALVYLSATLWQASRVLFLCHWKG